MYPWEVVCEETGDLNRRATHRLPVPGGWLYRYELDVPTGTESRSIAVTMAFVPESMSGNLKRDTAKGRP